MDEARMPSTQAQQIAEEFRRFTYIVSHDMNGPIRGMVEFSKLLASEHQQSLNEEAKEYLSLIVESGEKLQRMMAALLDYSRLNTMGKPPSSVDCNRVLSDCQIVLQDKIKATRAKLDIAPLPTVHADADQMMQLFLVLLDNAITYRAADTPPALSLAAEKRGSEWLFTLKDNGIGIGEQFHERVFQPFQRLHTESEYPGIGMGLALAKKIVERHAGHIGIDTAHTQGCAFFFTLPAGGTNA